MNENQVYGGTSLGVSLIPKVMFVMLVETFVPTLGAHYTQV